MTSHSMVFFSQARRVQHSYSLLIRLVVTCYARPSCLPRFGCWLASLIRLLYSRNQSHLVRWSLSGTLSGACSFQLSGGWSVDGWIDRFLLHRARTQHIHIWGQGVSNIFRGQIASLHRKCTSLHWNSFHAVLFTFAWSPATLFCYVFS